MTDEPAKPAMAPITVRIREACRMTGIGRSKFYELIDTGEIEIVKVGSMTVSVRPEACCLRGMAARGRQLLGVSFRTP